MYNPEIKPLDKTLVKRIQATDWSKFPQMLIGFDLYVDVNGNLGFYEGNSIPFALLEYEEMFGDDLANAIVKPLIGKGVVGINVNPRIDTPGKVREALVARKILQRNGIECLMETNFATRWDNQEKKFYFVTGSGRKNFDVLFNRCPSSQKYLRSIVPREHWSTAPVISPLSHTSILANKDKTRRALKAMGLETPLSYVVNNEHEKQEALDKIMKHIKKEHPNYEPPFILIKPVAGTGARKIRCYRDNKSPVKIPSYPFLVSERITSYGIEKNDGIHMIDTRMFYCGGYASHGMGRVAPRPVSQGFKGSYFENSAFVTSLCYIYSGGKTVKIDPKAEKIMNQHVLAAAIAINEAAKARSN